MKNNNIKVSLLLGIMCFLLTVGIFIQVKTVNGSGTAVAKTTKENELRDNVLEMKEKYEKQYKVLQSKEKELSDLINNASSNDSTSSELSEEIDKFNAMAGLTKVTGEGILVKLSDGDNANSIIHDSYLRDIVNELCNAGAEAISVNGERVVSTTAIECMGSVIKINDEKISSPFEIYAIGSKNLLESALNTSGRYVELLKGYGVNVEIKKMDSIVIDKYDGIFKFDYAR